MAVFILLACLNCKNKPQQNQLNDIYNEVTEKVERPNILLAIADDMSWIHSSFTGCEAISTPNIDYVARNGVWFNQAYCSAPSCTASRGALLTGRNGWELEEGACLWSILPSKFLTYTGLLEEAGYHVGYTGKGWGPGNVKNGGREKNPAGETYNRITNVPYERLGKEIPMGKIDYAANFEEFLEDKPEGQPFCFWFGCYEPHRDYLKGIGQIMGKDPENVKVPGFLPDVPEIRSDMLDYMVEIEWYDTHLGRMIDRLRHSGEIDNTIIVVTSDNGMPFPRAKANLYEYGTRMPLAIFYKKMIPGGRILEDLVSLTDLAPTFLEMAGLPIPAKMSGTSLVEILNSNLSGHIDPGRNRVFTYRERHAWVHEEGDIYPMRAMRKDNYLLIWNQKPDMYPAGDRDPQYNFNYYPYGDVDNSPTKDLLLSIQGNEDMNMYYRLAWGKRPEYELFNLSDDPFQMKNLAEREEQRELLASMKSELHAYLVSRGDLRMSGREQIYHDAPYYAMKGLESGGLFLARWESLDEEQKQKTIEREKKILEENLEKLEELGWTLE
jgi:N-sulfoglucosamine sulfohydrolase